MLNMDLLEDGANKLGIDLANRHIDQFGLYYHEILDGNLRTNLTRITDFEEMQRLHFVDSLSVIAALPGRMVYPNTTVIDIGSGAGLPGIPLKIAFPDIHLTLVESNGKKAEFLEHVIESLGIGDTIVVCSRAETAAHSTHGGLRNSALRIPWAAPSFTVASTQCQSPAAFCPQRPPLIARLLYRQWRPH